MSDRERRLTLIRRLLAEEAVESQEHLAELLAGEGVRSTQATLSRDLRDLGVIRASGPNGVRYTLDPRVKYRTALRRVVSMEIQRVRTNGQLVVVRTLAGRAEGVASFLDAAENPDILGTVAGDDTILVVPTDPSRCNELAAAIEALMDGEEP